MTDDETIVLRSSGLTRDIRFLSHNGLKSDIAPCPKSAKGGLRQSMARIGSR
jgi:hypothetical protein